MKHLLATTKSKHLQRQHKFKQFLPTSKTQALFIDIKNSSSFHRHQKVKHFLPTSKSQAHLNDSKSLDDHRRQAQDAAILAISIYFQYEKWICWKMISCLLLLSLLEDQGSVKLQ